MKRESVTCKFEHKQPPPPPSMYGVAPIQTGGLGVVSACICDAHNGRCVPIDDVVVVHKSNYAEHLPHSDTVHLRSTHDDDADDADDHCEAQPAYRKYDILSKLNALCFGVQLPSIESITHLNEPIASLCWLAMRCVRSVCGSSVFASDVLCVLCVCV